jgi:parvulin-like peptidyl-prolyl isomerase
MDATTPLCRWLRIGSVLLAAGCQTATARPQVPADPPLPLAPLAPVAPSAPASADPKPIVGLPVIPSGGPAAPVPPVQQVSREEKGAPAKTPLPEGEPRIKIIAHVGEKGIVTDEEVWEATRQRLQDYVSLVDGPGGKQIVEDPVKKKQVYEEELRRTIERELILDEMYLKLKKANKMNVVEEIREFAGKAADRQLREFKKRYKAQTDEDFELILLSQGLTVPVIRRQLERQMMAEEYVRSMLKEKNHGLSLAEIRDYYDKHPEEFGTPDRVKWLSIFISLNKFDSQKAAYEYANAIQQHAAAGEDFVALSKTYDQGLAGQAGGVGLGSERGKILPVDVEPTVWSLEPGQVSGLIETPAGYHIVKIAEREKAGVKPFDDKVQVEVRRKLMRNLQDVEYKRLVEKLWRGGVVRVVELPK